MSMLYVLIPLALGLLGLAVWALLWAIKFGQFDDLESHGWSVVLDDDQKPMPMADDLDDLDDADTDADADGEKQGAEPTAVDQSCVPGSTNPRNSNKRSSE